MSEYCYPVNVKYSVSQLVQVERDNLTGVIKITMKATPGFYTFMGEKQFHILELTVNEPILKDLTCKCHKALRE